MVITDMFNNKNYYYDKFVVTFYGFKLYFIMVETETAVAVTEGYM